MSPRYPVLAGETCGARQGAASRSRSAVQQVGIHAAHAVTVTHNRLAMRALQKANEHWISLPKSLAKASLPHFDRAIIVQHASLRNSHCQRHQARAVATTHRGANFLQSLPSELRRFTKSRACPIQSVKKIAGRDRKSTRLNSSHT